MSLSAEIMSGLPCLITSGGVFMFSSNTKVFDLKYSILFKKKTYFTVSDLNMA